MIFDYNPLIIISIYNLKLKTLTYNSKIRNHEL